ncbi:beta strand repeat-containing protein [Ruegeria arenilitoris]|uniref:beta strand repeat-containing protein n=1 Tax=Ruegeria arenilitoris TaxID=1173585 RepID=UPI001479F47F|nr:CHRD domain-containing protein [Ruegeria arenilitoris]
MLSQFIESLRARLLTTSTLAQETTRDGQTLINNFFQSTVVDDTPAFVLANDASRLLNFGEIVTNNAVAAVLAQGQDVDVFNFRSGRIEANNGPDALATGVQVTGSASVRNFGEIAAEFNGVQFAGPDSSGSLDNFRGGVISSDSRAVDIQGQGVDVRNFGDIIGTGDQRNGTIYTNSTAEDVSISNFTGGTIDAGEGNAGAGISLQVGDEVGDRVETDVFNGFGATIQGRGQAASNTGLAGDGIRIDDGAEGTILETEIINSGLISTESNQGTAAGIRIADGANTEGEILNTSTGVIEGPRNGLYIGNGEHDLDVLNFGTIQSGSRAVNIDGSGVDLINGGDILGTGDQRNGTVYADDTARDYSINNLATGSIDAGDGNNGAGISLSLSDEGNGEVEITNDGTIAGRGNAGAGLGTAGDGIRLEGARLEGGGFGPALFAGTITNTGSVTSEGANNTVGAFRAVNNVNFQGQLVNKETGLFAGVQNGVYFGTGDHAGGSFVNRGTVTSDSRALNIDGDGLEVVNEGDILGTGNQRNGTVYADGTADNYSFTNTGLVDAGDGNNGSAVSLQTGDVPGDVVSAVVVNEGTFQGRGDAVEGNQVGDGLRLFTNQDDASFAGVVVNEGLIAGSEDSDAAAGIRVDGGLNLLGAILNEGEIRGTVNAIDASDAGAVTIVNDDEGVINGNVLLGAGDDIFVDLGTTNGDISGGAGDDVLIAGDADNVLTGGLGNDFIDGGEGIDTADFSDLDVAVEVRLDANGNGTATRDTGFTVSVTDAVVDDPDQFGSNIPDAAWFVEEAILGNLYYNIHTADFPGGEIRGQLLVDSIETVNGIRTVTLSGGLDASQEPGPTSDSEATGEASVVITQDLNTGVVTYSSELSVVGLNEADLNTPIPGVVSAIHLHNAPAGANGPVVQDTLVDAGATLDVNATGGTGVIGQDVIDNQIETDVLRSIENVVGSDDGDVIVGSDLASVLNGGAGDDLISGEGGDDILIGGAGADTFTFGANFGTDVIQDFEVGIDQLQFGDFGPDFGGAVSVAQDGNDAVISFCGEGSVRLAGVNSADLTEDDFVA